MHRLIQTFLIFLIAVCAFAHQKLGFEGEEHAVVGIYVKDLSTGRVIAQNNAEVALLPASTMKAVTCAAALSKLGANYTFSTPVYLYGQPNAKDKSVWEGNLVIESCGDPTIDSQQFKDYPSLWREISYGLDNIGIRRITGRVIITEDLPDAGCPPQWALDDVPWPYGAGLYGFNFRDNKFALWPATLKTEPFQPGLEVIVTENEDGTEMTRGINSNLLMVSGRQPNNQKWRLECAMQNPGIVYGCMLEENLKAKGIAVDGNEVMDDTSRLLVCLHSSPVCLDILKETMHVSHNLFAEGMLRAIEEGGTRSEALKTENEWFKLMGVNPRYNNILDGSGLSRANRIQPRFLSDLLQKMAEGKNGEAYVSIFPRVGMDGTVKGLLEKTRLKGQLALKSGSVNAVQCFAGYKLDAEGKPTHTVVILVNSFYCPRAQVRASIEKFLLDIFK